ncbi:MAG: acyl--CoA ligase [Desulfobacteraceae bacterium]|nr:acyl--CoA ligase [Desulfobacteraceae bacterium]MBC2749225.1 acyl--CoA ligase [Desulfobacteraceae bacterium]
MLIHHFLENSASRYPSKVAVIHGGERVAYRDLNARADSLAAYLQANGIAKGDRIALLLENGVDYIVAYYATLKAGAVAAPLNPGLKPDGLRDLLHNLQPAAIITNFKCERLLKAVDLSGLDLKLLIIQSPKQSWANTPYTVAKLEDCLNIINDLGVVGSRSWVDNNKRPTTHDPQPFSNPQPTTDHPQLLSDPQPTTDYELNSSDLASIIYTSGSTGQPKGVMLSHANIVANTNSICQYLSISQNDIQMVVLPFFYVMGKSLLNTHIAAGGTVVINNQFAFPATVVKQMAEENVTAFSGVPSTFAYLLHRSPLAAYRDKLPHLRYCSQAGGHMAKSIKFALQKTLPAHTDIVIMYGATEASARLTYLPPENFESKIDSIGIAIPDVTIRIMDEKNQEVSEGTPGMLVAKGPNIMMGYWNDPEDTHRVLTQEGYHTGDIGYCDSEGFLYVTARKDGLIKVGGHRINPLEIEDFLVSTNLLIEAAVIGLPDNLLGNKLVAIVVPKHKNFSSIKLLKQCAETLTSQKCPSKIIAAKTLPKSASGKVDRQQCAEILKKILSQDI